MPRNPCFVLGVTVSMLLAQAGQAAGLSEALDRVPADAAVVISIPNLGEFRSAIEQLQAVFGGQQMDMGGVPMHLFEVEGLKRDGAMAVAIMSLDGAGNGAEPGAEAGMDEDDDMDWDDGGDEPSAIIIAPVSDFGAFIRALGGQPGAGPIEVEIEGETTYIKDIGGGFATLSTDRGLLEGFGGGAGNLAAHRGMLGATGQQLADDADMLIIANIPVVAPKIREGIDNAKMQMQFMAAMGGGDVTAATAFMDAFGEAFTRDGQVGLIGFGFGEGGMSLSFAAQFKEGSPSAQFLQIDGSASGLFGRVPSFAQQGFLLAAAVDTSSPGVKRMLQEFTEMQVRANPEQAEALRGFNMMDWISRSDGTAFVLGASPGGIMGGLMVNTVGYNKTSDARGYLNAFKTTTKQLHGKTIEDVTYTTEYTEGAATVAGVSVDTWSVRMKADPASPQAAQAAAMLPMIFGPAGAPGGYVAAVDGGVVMTMSKNQALLESAIKAARQEGETFAGSAGVKAVAGELPAGRVFEGYIGIRDILNTALPFMAMAMGPINVEVPQDLPPIGLAGTAQQGGARFTTVVPAPVLKLFAELSALAEGEEDDWMMEDEDEEEDAGAGRPRF